jgi:hypothetical protein
MEEFANHHRLPAPEFKDGDWVMLDARNIRTRKESQGLNHKNLGPYQIVRNIDDKAYELELKGDLSKIFPVFHPWLLHPVAGDPLPGQRQKPQGPVAIDEDDTPGYLVEDILDSKLDKRMIDTTGRKGLLFYLVKWEGWEDPTWEPYWNLTECDDLIAIFHRRRPDAFGPHQSFRYPQAAQEKVASLYYCDCDCT